MSIGRSISELLAWLAVGINNAYGESRFDWEQGLRVEWDETELRMGALLHADLVRFDEDQTELDDAEDFRRARITSRLDFDDWRLRADYDFGISEGWKSLFAEYRGIERLRLVGGIHTAPFSLEDNMSSSNLPFMERSTASALAPGLLTGVSVRHWGEDWILAGGLFGDEVNDLARRQADGQGLVGRAVWTPRRDEQSVVHLGLALERRKIDSGEALRLRARPFSRLADARLVDTRSIRDADRITTEGYELAWADGNRRLQAEWYRSRVAAPG